MKRTALSGFSRSRTAPYICAQCRKYSAPKVFQEGDNIILREAKKYTNIKFVKTPLFAGGLIQSHHGTIYHDAIIGKKKPTDFVNTNRDVAFTAHEPTLGEYVTLSMRQATPIYPDDANLIVSLLDLHPEPPSPANQPTDGPPLHILEAGTGHGALSMFIARAIHGANPYLSPETAEDPEAYAAWKKTRRAVLTTMDISAKHLTQAKKTIQGFRKGMYYHDMDVHVSTPRKFLSERGEDTPFLSHAILDMPGSQDEIATVAPHVHIGGSLVLFMPSVTQIVEAQRNVVEKELPLFLERVVELGPGISGGRDWSVRFVRKRKDLREEQVSALAAEDVEEAVIEGGEAEAGEVSETASSVEQTGSVVSTPSPVSVCRPLPGMVTKGGGFVGLWRRVEARDRLKSLDNNYLKGLK